jgi:transposase
MPKYGIIYTKKGRVFLMKLQGRPQKLYSKEQINEINNYYKKCTNAKEQRRILSIKLRVVNGLETKKISEISGLSASTIDTVISEYNKYGLEKILLKKQGGNHRYLSEKEEKDFLLDFEKQAEKGCILEIALIQKAYEEKIGKKVTKSAIYKLLRRHGWRKVMPRSKHPNKASDEAIEAYKKNY